MFNKITHLYIASDHGGWSLKEEIKQWLQSSKEYSQLIIEDFGTHNESESVDYPDYVTPVCMGLKNNKNAIGILVCGSGQGMAMAANKFKWIRAALVWSKELASLSRQHNNANVICLGGRVLKHELALQCLDTFLTTPFEGGRHENRVNKIQNLKNTEC